MPRWSSRVPGSLPWWWSGSRACAVATGLHDPWKGVRLSSLPGRSRKEGSLRQGGILGGTCLRAPLKDGLQHGRGWHSEERGWEGTAWVQAQSERKQSDMRDGRHWSDGQGQFETSNTKNLDFVQRKQEAGGTHPRRSKGLNQEQSA